MVNGIFGVAGFDLGHIALGGMVLYFVVKSNISAYFSRKERESLTDRFMAKSLPEFKFQTRPANKDKPPRRVPTDREMASTEREEQEREESLAGNNARIEEMLRQVKGDSLKENK